MSFALPDLPYPYEALQPYLSKESRQASRWLCDKRQ